MTLLGDELCAACPLAWNLGLSAQGVSAGLGQEQGLQLTPLLNTVSMLGQRLILKA